MERTPVIVVLGQDQGLPGDGAFDDLVELIGVRTADELRAAQARAEILLLWDFSSPLLEQVGPGGLAWIHTASIGVDAVMTPAILDAPVVVTNARGVFEPPVAEWALAAWLYLAQGFDRMLRQQRRGEWASFPVRLCADRRVLLLGPGEIGRQIAALVRAVGATVDVVGRTARDDDPVLGRVHGIDDLDALLPEADDVILALPLTGETTHVLDAQRLALLRPGAHVINLGRGALIDEPALVDALHSGTVGAAALDVFETEPLPEGHPFWSMDNVLVSPHTAGDVAGWERMVLERFVRNVERHRRGEPLDNVVDKRQFARGVEAA